MRKFWKAVGVLGLGIVLAFGGVPQALSAHGTTTEVITEDMLKTEPDEGYEVKEELQGEASDGEYDAYFLKDELQTVSIEVDENNLNYLLQNAGDKPYVLADSVTIGDETLGYVGLKTKGNYTLEHVVTDFPNSDRFSFTVNFGKYVKKKEYGVTQNFHGCSKISFNNFFFDKTMMKEYFALKLMTEMGVPTPQYGLAKLYINGGYYGVYFMVESMDESILEQYLDVDSDALSGSYLAKPYNCNLSYDEAMDEYLQEDGTFDFGSDLTVNEDGVYEVSGTLSGQDGLWEAEDDTLQDVAEVLPEVVSWERKLNLLSDGKDFSGKKLDVNSSEYLELLETVIDTDEVVRFFAVHSFLVQLDNMFVNDRNFGLYIGTDGKAMMIPWDYDLSYGCFHPGTSEDTANYDVDNMCWFEGASGNQESMMSYIYKRHPIFNVIYQNEALMEKYYSYMEDCSKISFLGGETSLGTKYEPQYFQSYIDLFEEKLVDAAGETLAGNVQYLNGTLQPLGVVSGLPNLAKIIAMRALGVYTQINNIDTYVSGYGCDLGAVGNGITSRWFQTDGNITSVDVETGMFLRADYGESTTVAKTPSFSVAELSKDDEKFQEIMKAAGMSREEYLSVYKIGNNAQATGSYTLTIPLTTEQMEELPEVYSYVEDSMEQLDMTLEGNLYSGELEEMGYLVVANTSAEKEFTGRIAAELRILLAVIALSVVASGVCLWYPFRKKGGNRK